MSLETTFSAIKDRAAASNPLGSTLKFNTGEGCIFLDGSGEANEVSQDDKEADCTVDIKLEDLEALIGGDLNPMAAFMGGKLKVKGDMGVAMKLQSLLG